MFHADFMVETSPADTHLEQGFFGICGEIQRLIQIKKIIWIFSVFSEAFVHILFFLSLFLSLPLPSFSLLSPPPLPVFIEITSLTMLFLIRIWDPSYVTLPCLWSPTALSSANCLGWSPIRAQWSVSLATGSSRDALGCTLTGVWQLYQLPETVLWSNPLAHTLFLKQSHFCSWLRTNNYMNTSAVILNNKVEMKRNFTLCINQSLVFMFGLKKSIPDWFLCIYRYCQRINWWIFHLMSQVE